MQDRLNLMSDEMKQKLEFMSANDELMKSKIEKIAKMKEDKHKDKMNYFPFVHGDAVEDRRSTIQESLKKDLSELHKERVQKSADKRRERLDKARENQIKEEKRQRQE